MGRIFHWGSYPHGSVKFFIGWMLCFVIRFLPFRPPNVEPVLSVQMPFAKRYGAIGAFVFGAMSIILFDLVTSGIGTWTIITSISYGLVGIGASVFFRNRKGTRTNYLTFGFLGVIFYDLVTGVLAGPIFFGQSAMVALMGQIPFTLYHLAGTGVLSIFVSPAIEKFVASNPRLELPSLIERLAPSF